MTSSKFYGNSTTEFMYESAAEGDDDGEAQVYTETNGSWQKYDFTAFPIDVEDIDRFNKKKFEDGEWDDMLLVLDVMTLVNSKGAILRQRDDGCVDCAFFDTTEELEAAWTDIENEWAQRTCQHCYVDAEEYGLVQPIVHINEPCEGFEETMGDSYAEDEDNTPDEAPGFDPAFLTY